MSGAQFTNFAGGNYQLLSGSPYRKAGTDGNDIGVWDWTALNTEVSNALNGTFAGGGSIGSGPAPPTGLRIIVM
jgi:hypothetical protein